LPPAAAPARRTSIASRKSVSRRRRTQPRAFVDGTMPAVFANIVSIATASTAVRTDVAQTRAPRARPTTSVLRKVAAPANVFPWPRTHTVSRTARAQAASAVLVTLVPRRSRKGPTVAPRWTRARRGVPAMLSASPAASWRGSVYAGRHPHSPTATSPVPLSPLPSVKSVADGQWRSQATVPAGIHGLHVSVGGRTTSTKGRMALSYPLFLAATAIPRPTVDRVLAA